MREKVIRMTMNQIMNTISRVVDLQILHFVATLVRQKQFLPTVKSMRKVCWTTYESNTKITRKRNTAMIIKPATFKV